MLKKRMPKGASFLCGWKKTSVEVDLKNMDYILHKGKEEPLKIMYYSILEISFNIVKANNKSQINRCCAFGYLLTLLFPAPLDKCNSGSPHGNPHETTWNKTMWKQRTITLSTTNIKYMKSVFPVLLLILLGLLFYFWETLQAFILFSLPFVLFLLPNHLIYAWWSAVQNEKRFVEFT